MGDSEYGRDIAAVVELFDMGLQLTLQEIEQALETTRDLSRESLLNLAEAAGIGEGVAFYLRVIEEVALLLKR